MKDQAVCPPHKRVAASSQIGKTASLWIVYNACRDVITCEACSWAIENKTSQAAKLALEGQSKAWISGFNAWQHGRAALSKHQNNQHHKECMNVRCTLLGKNNTNLLDQLISARCATATSNLKALRGIFNAVLLCGRQGLALRGQTDESSNFQQIINLIAKHNGDMQAWLTRKNTYKWPSHDIMNEILEMTSHAVLRDLVKEVQVAKYFSIICDETTDVSTTEQLSICVRYVDSAWAIKKVFLGLHAVMKCDSETLTTIVKSCLLSLNLPLSNCRRQAYDGAANMRGNISGVQARIKESNKTAMYVYCMGHQLNLVVQECITNTVERENALQILNKVSKFVTASPKRLELSCISTLHVRDPRSFKFKTSLPYPLGPMKGVSRCFSQQLRKAVVGLAVQHVQLDKCTCQNEISSPIVSFVIGEV